MDKKTYSQFGEDSKIINFFQNKSSNYYVEVGANDGIRDSNTALLEQDGWKGLLIEANPELIPLISQYRPNSIVIHSAVVAPDKIGSIDFHQVVGGPTNLDGLSTTIGSDTLLSRIYSYGGEVQVVKVPATTLDDILMKNNVPHEFEFLSLDVEGAELEVLKGLSLNRFHPRIILIEDNSYGADLSVRNHLRQQGYIRVHRTGVNDWYVQAKDIGFFFKERIILFLRLTKWSLQRRYQSIN